VERCNVLISGSKDGYVRAWDLGTQHCFQIAAGQQGEVRSSTVSLAPAEETNGPLHFYGLPE
jgi:WD40 repeat protein